MTVILLIIIVALAVALALQHARHSNKLDDERMKHFAELGLMQIDYEALDQGMTEVQDAYQSDSLQYEESLQKAFEKNQHLEGVLAQALDKIKLLEEDVQASQQAALDLQVVAAVHDEACLPVLDEMRDTDS